MWFSEPGTRDRDAARDISGTAAAREANADTEGLTRSNRSTGRDDGDTAGRRSESQVDRAVAHVGDGRGTEVRAGRGRGNEPKVEIVVENRERRRQQAAIRDTVMDFAIVRESPEVRTRTGERSDAGPGEPLLRRRPRGTRVCRTEEDALAVHGEATNPFNSDGNNIADGEAGSCHRRRRPCRPTVGGTEDESFGAPDQCRAVAR